VNAPDVAAVVKAIDQAMIDGYARASGDFNPVHVDADFARATPLGGTIAHGMLVLAFISEMMAAAFGRAWVSSGRLDVRFRNPARPGDTVTARANAARPVNGALQYNVECVNQKGEVLISGSARVDAL